MEYLVVIPYLAAAAQGRELEFAIAGWQKHFKEEHRIVIIGEGVPKIRRKGITCIESKRVEAPGQYRQHVDYVSCFRKVHKKFPDSEGFIFVADDCYAVNDFNIADVKCLKMQEPDIFYDENSPNMWRQDKLKTMRLLKSEGYRTRNFTTHLPYWFDWDKIEALWDKYDMDHQSYVIEDLYYNIYNGDMMPFQLDVRRDNLKYTASNTTPNEAELRQAFVDKIWINNSPDGYTKILELLLDEHYFGGNV